MMAKRVKIKLVCLWILLFIVLFLNLLTLATGESISKTVTIIEGGDYVYEEFDMFSQDILDIEIKVIKGEIDLVFHDKEQFDKFIHKKGNYYEEYVRGITGTKEYEFEAPYSDTWYVVFWSSSVNTEIKYTITHESPTMKHAIVTIISGFALLGVILIVNFIGGVKK